MSTPAPRPRPQRPEGVAVGHHGEILTATMIEQAIMRLSAEMETLTHDLARRAEASADAEAKYKVKFAQQRLIARDGVGRGPGGRVSNDEADDIAIRACADELRGYLIAGALHGSLRDALFAKRAQMEALRTIAANIRAQT